MAAYMMARIQVGDWKFVSIRITRSERQVHRDMAWLLHDLLGKRKPRVSVIQMRIEGLWGRKRCARCGEKSHRILRCRYRYRIVKEGRRKRILKVWED